MCRMRNWQTPAQSSHPLKTDSRAQNCTRQAPTCDVKPMKVVLSHFVEDIPELLIRAAKHQPLIHRVPLQGAADHSAQGPQLISLQHSSWASGHWKKRLMQFILN